MIKLTKIIEKHKKAVQKDLRVAIGEEIVRILKGHPKVKGFVLDVQDDCYNDEEYYSEFNFNSMKVETEDGTFVRDLGYFDDDEENLLEFDADGGGIAEDFVNVIEDLLEDNQQEIIDFLGGGSIVMKEGKISYE